MNTITSSALVHRDPDILGGVLVFIGTRVPAKSLFDYLAAGHPLSEFLDDFPSVKPEQALGLLEEMKHILQRESDEAFA